MFTATARRRLVLAPLALLVACDVALLPEAASYEGTSAPKLSLRVAADAMPGADVQAVDVELVDVMVHRASDDAWVWIGGGVERVELGLELVDANRPVPLPADVYDGVIVVVDAPRVAHGGKWHSAALAHDEIELEVEIDLDADQALELHFDLGRSLAGSKGDQWTFDPSARAAVAP